MKEEQVDFSAPDIEPRLFCWGSGTFGQHGHVIDETIYPFDGFLKNPSVEVSSVFCGACYTFVLKGDGNVLGWGSNQNGQIGCAHQRQCLTPTRAEVENVVQVSAGDRHTLFLLRDGSVRGCGCNFYAQLSVDALEELQRQDKLTPIALPLPEKVKQVACGQYHSVLLYESGDVASVGRNIYGQLGVPMPDGVKTDVLETPTTMEGVFKGAVAKVSAGQNHSIAIEASGRCYVWGYCRACGSRGAHIVRPKLLTFSADADAHGAGDDPPAIANASGGSSHSLFLATDYTGGSRLFALGCNLDGQCGLGKAINFAARPVPLDLGWAAGADVTSVDCAENYSCAVTGAGELWLWGRNPGVLPSTEAATVDAPRVFAPQRAPVPFAVLSAACGNWHVAAIVNYREPKDVSHLPGGRSTRQQAAVAAAAMSTASKSSNGESAAWVDIVSSREEKPLSMSSSSTALGPDDSALSKATTPADPLALEDLDACDSQFGGKAPPTLRLSLNVPRPRPPLPPSSSAVAAGGMRRSKSLFNRVPGGDGRQQQMRLLRRVQPPPPVQVDSELVHVYQLASGAGRSGTATYQAQATNNNGPPQLGQRRAKRPGNPQALAGELGSMRLTDTDAAVVTSASAARPPLPTQASRSGAVGSIAGKLGSLVAQPLPPSHQVAASATEAAPTGAIRRRPVSASGGGGASVAPALLVRQNLASLRRMSSGGRLRAGEELP